MSIVRRLEKRDWAPTASGWFDPYHYYNQQAVPPPTLYGLPNWTGEPVNEDTALQIAAVQFCVGLIADALATLPIRVYRRSRWDGGKPPVTWRAATAPAPAPAPAPAAPPVPPTPPQQLAPSNPLWIREELPQPPWLRQPNAQQLPYEFIVEFVTSLLLHGNAYIYIDRTATGAPAALTVLHPAMVTVQRDDKQIGGAIRYSYRTGDGEIDLPTDVLRHIKWISVPQRPTGMSPLAQSRATLGLALAMERHLGQFYGDGAIPSAILSTPERITSDQAQQLQRDWTSLHNRRRKVAVLGGGLTYNPIAQSASDAQLAESREQQWAEIARVFRVPAWLLGIKGDTSTYQNVEQAGEHLVRYTLTSPAVRLEQALTSILPAPQYAATDFDALQRADLLSRMRAYDFGVRAGIYSPNEVRERENLEPFPGGDQMFFQPAGPTPTAPPSIGHDIYDEPDFGAIQ